MFTAVFQRRWTLALINLPLKATIRLYWVPFSDIRRFEKSLAISSQMVRIS